LHGLVDGGRLFICARNTAAGPLQAQLPQPPEGLGFAEAYHLTLDWDVAAEGFEAELFSALPEQLAGLSCGDLLERATPLPLSDAGLLDAGTGDAGITFPSEPAAPRRAGSLTLPPGALRPNGHYVFVAAGCATPGIEPVAGICGNADDLFGSYKALIFAGFGEQLVDAAMTFGLQFLNASRALGRTDLLLQENSATITRLAADVPFRALRPPASAAAREPVGVELRVAGQNPVGYTQSWADTLTWSGLAAVESGRNYLLVYLGPAPNVTSSPGFAPPRFVLVPGPN
jgi:hypothetical protein